MITINNKLLSISFAKYEYDKELKIFNKYDSVIASFKDISELEDFRDSLNDIIDFVKRKEGK